MFLSLHVVVNYYEKGDFCNPIIDFIKIVAKDVAQLNQHLSSCKRAEIHHVRTEGNVKKEK